MRKPVKGRKKEKGIYHITDWKSYNAGLCNRYNIDIWIDGKAIKNWYYKGKGSRKAGAINTYSKTAILTCHRLRALLGLSLRGTQGFLNSLFKKMNLAIRCPDYSQLCRRAKDLRDIKLPRSNNEAMAYLFALVDSTGLKVYGQGEWHVKMHKASKRRTWRKLSLVVDPVSQDIIDNKLTTSNTHDSRAFLKMLSKLPKSIEQIWGDGAYDTSAVYEALYSRKIKPIIPPQRNATVNDANYRKKGYLGRSSVHRGRPAIISRDCNVEYINLYPDPEEGRKEWKRHSLYHLRSLAETAMMRFKQSFSDKLRSRNLVNQQAEVRVKCSILNKMLQIASANSKTLEFLLPLTT